MKGILSNFTVVSNTTVSASKLTVITSVIHFVNVFISIRDFPVGLPNAAGVLVSFPVEFCPAEEEKGGVRRKEEAELEEEEEDKQGE